MPYTVKGKCVYKKDTGKKVGCTDGSVDKYLGALHANANENTNGSPSKDVKVEITNDSVVITRTVMNIKSTTTLHLGRRATQQEADALRDSVLEADKDLPAAFRRRFGLGETSMKLMDIIKENNAPVPSAEENQKLLAAQAYILAYLKKFPEKEAMVMGQLNRHVQKNKEDLKKYDANSDGRWDAAETARRRQDLAKVTTRPPQG